MEKQKTCKDLVKGHLESRMEDLRTLWDAYLEGKEDVDDLGNIYDYGLSFDYVPSGTFNDQKKGYFRYQLSWGGPSDEFRFFIDLEKNVVNVEYWYLDWFDGAPITPSGKDIVLLSELLTWFDETGTLDKVYNEATND